MCRCLGDWDSVRLDRWGAAVQGSLATQEARLRLGAELHKQKRRRARQRNKCARDSVRSPKVLRCRLQNRSLGCGSPTSRHVKEL